MENVVMKSFEFVENGKTVKAQAELVKNTLWVHLNGETLALEVDNGRISKRKTKASQSNPNQIMSPMPGKITKIIVQAGQSVKEGDSVIVMEAMKMEYTLKSSINAKVKKINCQVNEQVTLGALLVELEN